MNKTEYLADLTTKVVAFKDPINKAGPVVTSPPDPSQSNQAVVAAIEAGELSGLGTITSWVAPVITIQPRGVYGELQVRFRVMNLGVEGEETVLPETVIENPLGDVIDAVAYWEALKADPASSVVEYREIIGEDKRADLGFDTIKAWVREGDNVREAVFLTNRDSEGNPQHIEIV